MKKVLYSITLLILTTNLCSQQILRLNESSPSYFFSEAEVIGDSLLVYYIDSLDHQYFGTSKNFKVAKFGSQNGIAQSPAKTKKVNYTCMDYNWVQLDSTHTFKVGTEFTDITTAQPKPHIWYKEGRLDDFDSLDYYQFSDSTYTFYINRKSFLINGAVYSIGGANRSDYPFRELFIIKHNFQSSSYSISTYEMPTSFGLVNDVLYDNKSTQFIITTSSQLGSGQIPFGAGICKIDTNLNLDTSSIKTMQVHYPSYLFPVPNPYKYHTALEKLDSNRFLIVGCVENQSQLSISNPKGGRDFAVGIRSLDSLKEIGQSKIIGKKDTADNLLVGDLKLKKVDSNQFLTMLSVNYINPVTEPWNTTSSAYGIDEQGNKQWEYHLDMQDYCWVRDFYPAKDGGLWIINQCSENRDFQNGTFDYFMKVAYLDSSIFWPGVLTDVVEPEQKASELKIYPNPASDQITIKQYGQIVPLEGLLFSLNGQLLKRFPINSHQNQLSVSQMKPSNYILKIIDAKGREVKTEKIVVVE